jgi:hypothetical protein
VWVDVMSVAAFLDSICVVFRVLVDPPLPFDTVIVYHQSSLPDGDVDSAEWNVFDLIL